MGEPVKDWRIWRPARLILSDTLLYQLLYLPPRGLSQQWLKPQIWVLLPQFIVALFAPAELTRGAQHCQYQEFKFTFEPQISTLKKECSTILLCTWLWNGSGSMDPSTLATTDPGIQKKVTLKGTSNIGAFLRFVYSWFRSSLWSQGPLYTRKDLLQFQLQLKKLRVHSVAPNPQCNSGQLLQLYEGWFWLGVLSSLILFCNKEWLWRLDTLQTFDQSDEKESPILWCQGSFALVDVLNSINIGTFYYMKDEFDKKQDVPSAGWVHAGQSSRQQSTISLIIAPSGVSIKVSNVYCCVNVTNSTSSD